MAFSLFEFSNIIMAYKISGRKEQYVWAGALKQRLVSCNWNKVEWLFLALQRAQEAVHALLIATEFGSIAWLFINLKTCTDEASSVVLTLLVVRLLAFFKLKCFLDTMSTFLWILLKFWRAGMCLLPLSMVQLEHLKINFEKLWEEQLLSKNILQFDLLSFSHELHCIWVSLGSPFPFTCPLFLAEYVMMLTWLLCKAGGLRSFC